MTDFRKEDYTIALSRTDGRRDVRLHLLHRLEVGDETVSQYGAGSLIQPAHGKSGADEIVGAPLRHPT